MNSLDRNPAQLGLPSELFLVVLEELIADVGIERAVKYRLVNRNFGRTIDETIFLSTSKLRFDQIFEDRSLSRYFQAHGAALLIKKHGRYDPVLEHRDGMLNLVEDLSAKAMKKFSTNPTDKVSYIAKICDCLMARIFQKFKKNALQSWYPRPWDCESPGWWLFVDFSNIYPALGTAVGDAATISSTAQQPKVIIQDWEPLFPTPLMAAVAVNNIPALRKYLLSLFTGLIVNEEVEYWQRKEAAEAIVGALRDAIRLHQHKAARVIFGFFENHKEMFYYIVRRSPEWVFSDAAKYGNRELVYRVLQFQRTTEVIRAQNSSRIPVRLGPEQIKVLLKIGRRSLVIDLLRDGLLKANGRQGSGSNLHDAFANFRPDLADVLLNFGANMYWKDWDGVTTLWRALSEAHFRDVRLMLAYGGDLDRACPKRDPQARGKLRWFKKSSLLYKLSKTEAGRDQLRRRDLSMADLARWSEAHSNK